MPAQLYARANPNASPFRVEMLSHCFCKTRGNFNKTGNGENAKDGYRVNLGCVEELDPMGLEIGVVDGKGVPLVEEPR